MDYSDCSSPTSVSYWSIYPTAISTYMLTIIHRCCRCWFALVFLLPSGTLKMTTAVKSPMVIVIIPALVVYVFASPFYNILLRSLLPHALGKRSSQTKELKEILLPNIHCCFHQSWGCQIYIWRNAISPFPPLNQIDFTGIADITPPNTSNPPSYDPTQRIFRLATSS